MTGNQIAYWTLQETSRSNRARESETMRHNVETETETNRHNLTTENVDIGKLQETQRHNKSTEAETNRHNLVTESVDVGNLEETQRHNKATESANWTSLSETQRHNLRTEMLTGTSIALDSEKLAETVRHNTESEQISKYSAEAEAIYKQAKTETERYVAQNQASLSANQISKIQAEIRNMERSYRLAVKTDKRQTAQMYLNQLREGQNNLKWLLSGALRLGVGALE